jgi:hypothetical protein
MVNIEDIVSVSGTEIDAMSHEELDTLVSAVRDDPERAALCVPYTLNTLSRFLGAAGLEEVFMDYLESAEMVAVIVALESVFPEEEK